MVAFHEHHGDVFVLDTHGLLGLDHGHRRLLANGTGVIHEALVDRSHAGQEGKRHEDGKTPTRDVRTGYRAHEIGDNEDGKEKNGAPKTPGELGIEEDGGKDLPNPGNVDAKEREKEEDDDPIEFGLAHRFLIIETHCLFGDGFFFRDADEQKANREQRDDEEAFLAGGE